MALEYAIAQVFIGEVSRVGVVDRIQEIGEAAIETADIVRRALAASAYGEAEKALVEGAKHTFDRAEYEAKDYWTVVAGRLKALHLAVLIPLGFLPGAPGMEGYNQNIEDTFKERQALYADMERAEDAHARFMIDAIENVREAEERQQREKKAKAEGRPATAEELEESERGAQRLERLEQERSNLALSESQKRREALRLEAAQAIADAGDSVWKREIIEKELTAALELEAAKQAQAVENAEKRKIEAAEERLQRELEAQKAAQAAFASSQDRALESAFLAGVANDETRERMRIEMEYRDALNDTAATEASNASAKMVRDEQLRQLEESGAKTRQTARKGLYEEIRDLEVATSEIMSELEKAIVQNEAERSRALSEAANGEMAALTNQKFDLLALQIAQQFAEVGNVETKASGAFGGEGIAQEIGSTQDSIEKNTKSSATYLKSVKENMQLIAEQKGLVFG
jgi:hypothetical protein